MGLNELFNGMADATLIYRGDCTKRGYLGTPCFEEGKRFELTVEGGAYTFVADKVTVLPLGWLTEEHFNKHIHGHAITPLLSSDRGSMNDAKEPCTVIEFRKETGRLIPPSWMGQNENRPA